MFFFNRRSKSGFKITGSDSVSDELKVLGIVRMEVAAKARFLEPLRLRESVRQVLGERPSLDERSRTKAAPLLECRYHTEHHLKRTGRAGFWYVRPPGLFRKGDYVRGRSFRRFGRVIELLLLRRFVDSRHHMLPAKFECEMLFGNPLIGRCKARRE